MHLNGNTMLITGGTSGIGLAFAEKFLELGNKVIICGRRENRLKEINERHKGIIIRTCDVAEASQRELLAEWTLKNHPDLNILINNAGIQLLSNLAGSADINKINEEVATNLIAPVHLTSLFATHLKGKKEAAIVNITSGLAFAPLAPVAVYCATKAALHSISMSLRYQLKDTSVKVFEIAPPSVDTELGKERRTDPNSTHGGIPVEEFIGEAIKSLENNIFESAVGMAENMRRKREELFNAMNR